MDFSGQWQGRQDAWPIDIQYGTAMVCPMKLYEVYFIDHLDQAFARSSFEAEDHASAIKQANARFRVNVGKGHAIWHAGECIHTETYKLARD